TALDGPQLGGAVTDVRGGFEISIPWPDAVEQRNPVVIAVDPSATGEGGGKVLARSSLTPFRAQRAQTVVLRLPGEEYEPSTPAPERPTKVAKKRVRDANKFAAKVGTNLPPAALTAERLNVADPRSK